MSKTLLSGTGQGIRSIDLEDGTLSKLVGGIVRHSRTYTRTGGRNGCVEVVQRTTVRNPWSSLRSTLHGYDT